MIFGWGKSCRVLSEYCSPLDYVSARPKLFPRGGKLVPHFRRSEALSDTGEESPKGRRGSQHITGEMNGLFVASLNTTNTSSECYLSFRLTDSEGAATKTRSGRPLRACFDFNLSSLSRARKLLPALQAKIFRRCSLTKQVHGKETEQ